MRIKLEVICVTVDDAIAAEKGGADRIELIANYLEGGTTPSAGIVKAVKEAVTIPVYVMIRPYGGGFVYTDREVEAMMVDARLAREMGADGIVTGILRADGGVDTEAVGRVVDAAGLPTTFHRAFDCLPAARMPQALRQLESIPLIERVLTSGGRPTAFEGRDMLRQLVKEKSRLMIMPGGNVMLESVQQLIRETGVQEVHVGLTARAEPTPTSPVSARRVQMIKEAVKH